MRFSSYALLALSAGASTSAFVFPNNAAKSSNPAAAAFVGTSSVMTASAPPAVSSSVVAQKQKRESNMALAAEGIKVTMPALSSTMKEGKIVSWLKAEGEEIEAGEAIMVVESDKADMDVEAFEDGFLAKILTGEGESANVGDVVALIASEESEIADVVANGTGEVVAVVEEAAPAADAGAAAGGYSVPTTEIFMPALSSTMTEGKIVSWLKAEGDAVSAGEAIMVVESDKADMDVESFDEGYIAKIFTEEGETADVGALVAVIVENEEDIAAVQSGPAPAAPAAVATASAPAAAEPDCEFSKIDMPALSSTMKEGKIVSWMKSEGDAVSAGEAIMVVESDKADMDVEAFEDGYIAAIITEEGETANVGSPVAIIVSEESDIPTLKAYAATLTGGEAAPAAVAAPAPAAPVKTAAKAAPKAAASTGGRVVASPLAKKKAAEMGVDLTTVGGSGPAGRITVADVVAAAQGGGAPAKAAPAEPTKPKHIPAAGVIAATPTARALAKKAKIDLATIEGTGEFGRVTVDDVMIATGEKKAPKKARATPTGEPAVELRDDLEPFTSMQRGVSKNMEATLSVPIFRVSRAIVTDKFDALYQSVKPKGVTVSALLAKAVALAAEKIPVMNSNYDPSGGIKWNADINIAMAVAINGGLITPVLKNANERNILELGEDWKALVGKAKAGTLTPDEFSTGTFTISNLGMFGVSQFDAILPPGQGSILAIGGTTEVVVPDKSAVLGLKTQKQMTVTLTCDHRNIYGADAALFLKAFADIMENNVESLLL